MTTRNDTIERLRQSGGDDKPPTLASICGLRDSLLMCVPLQQTAQALDVDPSQVLDWVGKLGTWLTHAATPVEADSYLVVDEDQPALFTSTAGTVRPMVAIPAGYERRAAHKRDVVKALKAIVTSNPDDTVLARWIDHAFPVLAKVLKYTHLTTVHQFASLGRLDEIDQLNPKSATFNELLVTAWDQLTVALDDARAGITVLVSDTDDLDLLTEACQRSWWLAEARISRIRRQVDACRERPGPVTLAGLRSMRDDLGRQVRSSPQDLLPSDIGQLSQGQVMRLAQSIGLQTVDNDRSEEVEIRARLRDMGVDTDLDRLVRRGIAATQAGIVEEFWAAMDARISGDPSWSEQLSDAFEYAGTDEP